MINKEICILIQDLMPEVVKDLKDLIKYQSVAFPGYPEQPVYSMANATVELLNRYGLRDAHLIEISNGYPAIFGELPAPPGMPTILLYSHYDVQPADKIDGWTMDPWTSFEKDGRIYGRGSADDKSGIMITAALIKVFNGKPPIGIKILIEGEEETISHLDKYIIRHPDLVKCDIFVILDLSNISTGNPGLTTSLRGEISCMIDVKTLKFPVHSGTFGGVVPDALISLIQILATLHDPNGNVAIKGLTSYLPPDNNYSEEIIRKNSGLLMGVDLIGSGSLSSRIWSKPSISVLGIDVPSISKSSSSLIPQVKAKISLRISPNADPKHEMQVLKDHLFAVSPWNVHIEVTELKSTSGFICPTTGSGFSKARVALKTAFEKEEDILELGAGSSIPLLKTLQEVVPDAEFILCGAMDDASSHFHGVNESVDINDLERLILAQYLFIELLTQKL